MDLNLDGKKVGDIYFNIQLKIENLIASSKIEGGSQPAVLRNIVGLELDFEGKTVIVKSFRNKYTDDDYVYIEGAVIEFK